MLRPRPIRNTGFAISLTLACALGAGAQTVSTLPPTAPTTAPAQQIAPLSGTAARPDAATRGHRAEVRYASGLLSINANNSSLNQILREISRQTGMKITGGVTEERVFGHYGPAAPAVILKTLIDGTSTNMMLRETASNTPEELILTPRGGGASPPNPNASGFDDSGDDDDSRPAPPQRVAYPQPQQHVQVPANATNPALVQVPGSVPPSIPQPANNVLGNPANTSPTASTLPVTDSVPIDSIPTPSTTPAPTGIVDAPNPPDPGTVNPVATNPPVNPNPPATDSTTPATPGAPKTPEDYARELQKLRQQQQQQKSTTPQ
jgi:hypothetical protein